MRDVKVWHFLWILWLVLAVANLLFVNVYVNHFGTLDAGVKTLTDVQMLGYYGMSLIFAALVGIWWIMIGNSKGAKGRTIVGAILTSVFGLALIGCIIYVFALDGAYLRKGVEFLADKLSFISF